MISVKLLIYAVCALLIVSDLDDRFLVDQKIKQSTRVDVNLAGKLPVRLPEKQKILLLDEYHKLSTESLVEDSSRAEGNDTMSLEQQKLQQGSLEQLFAGDKIISLNALINHAPKPLYALLSIQNTSTGNSELKKLHIGQTLFGYVVNDLSLKALTLKSIEQPDRIVTLTIYNTNLKDQIPTD
ncbi:hypothetical protein [Paraglaciecola sp.]|uniref:hypothetical protein n=1 Tax=Paraglaciecola sp. TaxID=1920173 RepID=UPI003EFA57C3